MKKLVFNIISGIYKTSLVNFIFGELSIKNKIDYMNKIYTFYFFILINQYNYSYQLNFLRINQKSRLNFIYITQS